MNDYSNRVVSKEDVKQATLEYFSGDTLATDVWMKKYALRTSENEFLEKTPDDMHKRIAKEFARIEFNYLTNSETSLEEIENKIYEKLKNFKEIVPQGSPMFGIGNDFQTVSLGNCFTENNSVLTNKGYVKINNIKIGDLVLTHKGRWKKVVNVMSRYYEGELDVYSSSILTDKIEVTPEHPFFNGMDDDGNDVWVESKDNEKLALLNHLGGDIKFIKNFRKESKYFAGWVYNCSVEDDESYVVNNVICHNCFVIGNEADSYGGILVTDEHLAQIAKRRGGVGLDLSHIRPTGTVVHNSALSSTGIVPFMERYSNTTREVAQCIAEGQQVLVKDRGYINIESVIPGNFVWTKNEWVKVLSVYSNGRKEVIKVTTDTGYEITTTKDHLYQTCDSNGNLTETRLEDLNVGSDIILCLGTEVECDSIFLDPSQYVNSNNKPSKCALPNQLNEELAYLLGYSYGDGYVILKNGEKNGLSLSCSDDYPRIKEKLSNIIKNQFDYEVKITTGDGKLEELVIYNKTITQFLLFNDLLKEKSKDIIFPEKIKSASSSIHRAFIAGYFDADGCAKCAKKKGYTFASISKNFLNDCQQLLIASLGIQSKLKVEKRSDKGWNDLYSLSVVGQSAQERFVTAFKDFSVKVDETLFISKRDCWITPFTAESANINHSKYNFVNDRQNLSMGVIRKLKKHGENVNDNLLKDTIKSKEVLSEEVNTFDLELESEHLFLCNGLYVHNSNRRGALMITISIKHPSAEEFIDAKVELKKVTGANISVKLTNEFLEAVRDNKEFIQQFPIDSDNPSIVKKIDARTLWKKIIANNHKSAEPGILIWDNIIAESPADCYKDFGFETISTNPCLTGETKVLVADGSEKEYTIKELAEVGMDVPVYCYDDEGNVVIRKMINPRVTGYNQKIYKVILEDGYTIRTTANHKFLLTSGEYKRVDELTHGDSLKLLSKTVTTHSESSNTDYYRFNTNQYEHRVLLEHKLNRKLNQEEIVHHLDGNGLNNNLDNLELMSKDEHSRLHVLKKPAKERKLFAESAGEKNDRFMGISNEELLKVGIQFTKSLNRRFSKKEWMKFAESQVNIPKAFSKFRINDLGTLLEFSETCARKAGIPEELIDLDPRVVKTLHKAKEMGYNTKIVNDLVYIENFCEECGSSFWKNFQQREISFCSQRCAVEHIAKREEVLEKRKNSIHDYHGGERANDKRLEQARIYSNLKFKLGRDPLMKEWEAECKTNSISYRLKSKFAYQSFDEVKEAGNNYNHKVISVEEDGFEDVYNGTVEEFHNFFVGGFGGFAKNGRRKCIYINNLNCGELPLSLYDSCRLLVVNLFSFVKNPFSDSAYFDYDSFKKTVVIAQRLMDDMIDLEEEKINKILAKIERDPEPEEIKRNELLLWKTVKKSLLSGRRTGIGITGLGDVFASLKMVYASPESIEFSDELFKSFGQSVFISNVQLAKERGHFPVFNYELEKDNSFINRIIDSFEDSDEKTQLISDYKTYGRRNISESTIAPTGSVSILTQTSSGVEPVFSVYYKRRRKTNNDSTSKIHFTDEMGDHWEEYNVIHPRFNDWYMNTCNVINGIESIENMPSKELDKLIEESPYHHSTAPVINWQGRVKLQGTIQKWISHSISSTVNLPHDISEDEIDKIYMTAWTEGCKGITIYRDGCRDGVLITNNSEKKPNIFEENHAPKRGNELPCDVMRFVNKGERWIGFLGLLNNRPYEVFTGPEDEVTVPKYVTHGITVKTKNGDKKNVYNFVWVDKDGVTQEYKAISRAFNREYQNIGRMVSAILRHGMPLPNIIQLIDKLEMDNDHLTNWKNGVKRMLKKYIADGTKVKGSSCPDCNSADLLYQNGCLSCQNCGWSKCG